MPFIRFTGFAPGAAVALSATQGGASDSATIAQWGVPTSGASLTIQTSRAPEEARFAPEAVFFEAQPAGFDLPAPSGSPWYRPEMHEIDYEWDFGDAGATYAAPENTVPDWKDANRGFGQCVAHVFSQPGTYTVTCTARKVVSLDPVTVVAATAVTSVTDADPADFFGRNPHQDGVTMQFRTIVVAKDGDFTGADPDWKQATTEGTETGTGYKWFYKAITEALYNNAADPADAGYMRILFKRGETYTENLDIDERFTNGIMRCVLFGSWGDPQQPPPKFTASAQGVIRNEFGFRDPAMVWDGLDFEGDYDPVTQTAGPNTGTGIAVNTGAHRLITNCRISKHSGGVFYAPPRDESDQWTAPRLVIHNTEMTELASYGLYAEDRNAPYRMTDIAMLGCKDIDVGNAPSGGTGSIDGNANSQGPVRVWGRGLTIIDGCDFFGRYGWSGAGSWADGANVTAAQAIRAPGNGTFDGTGRTFVTRVAFEGGGAMLVMGSAVATTPPYGNAVVDQFLHVGAASTKDSIGLEMGGVTVRNGLIIKPSTVNSETKPLTKVVGAGINKAPGTTTPAGVFDAPIRVHNCTIVVLDTSADQTFPILDAVGFTDTSVENNLVYAPGYALQPDHLDFAPFDATELFDVRWLGRMEVADNGVLQTDYAAPDGSVSLYQPQAGSPALGAATSGRIALYDMRGRERGALPAIGALDEG